MEVQQNPNCSSTVWAMKVIPINIISNRYISASIYQRLRGACGGWIVGSFKINPQQTDPDNTNDEDNDEARHAVE